MRWLAVLLVVPALATAAHAELYRCTGRDGATIFTDQKKNCPGAEASEPAGVVQHAETPESSNRDSASGPASGAGDSRASDEAAAEAFWRQKKRDAETQVERARAEREAYGSYAGHCRRPGAHAYSQDEAGIKQYVPCDELLAKYHDLEQQETAARDYLETGLSEECRRAGCLPGWLR